jgi:hypothetical protein
MGETRLANKLDHSLFRVKPRKQVFLDKACKINAFTLELFLAFTWVLAECTRVRLDDS